MVTYRSLVPGFLVLVAGVLFFGSPAYACPQGLVCAPGKSCPPEGNCIAASEPATAPAVTSGQSSEVREQGQAPRQFEGDSLRTATERGAQELLEGGQILVPGTAPTRIYDTATISSQIGNIQRAIQEGEAAVAADQTPDASDPPQGPWPASWESFLDWLYYPGYADGLPPGTGIPPGTGPMLPYPGYPDGLPPGPTPGPLPTGDPIPGDDPRPTRDDNVDPDRELGAAAGVIFGPELSATRVRFDRAFHNLRSRYREFSETPIGRPLGDRRAAAAEAWKNTPPRDGAEYGRRMDEVLASEQAFSDQFRAYAAEEHAAFNDAHSDLLAEEPNFAVAPPPASVGLAVPVPSQGTDPEWDLTAPPSPPVGGADVDPSSDSIPTFDPTEQDPFD